MAELGQMPGDARKRRTEGQERIIPADLGLEIGRLRDELARLRLGLGVLVNKPFDTLEVEAAENVVEVVKVVRADDIRILLKGGQP